MEEMLTLLYSMPQAWCQNPESKKNVTPSASTQDLPRQAFIQRSIYSRKYTCTAVNNEHSSWYNILDIFVVSLEEEERKFVLYGTHVISEHMRTLKPVLVQSPTQWSMALSVTVSNSTFYVGMGQVQNGHLYLWYGSSSMTYQQSAMKPDFARKTNMKTLVILFSSLSFFLHTYIL